MVAVAPDVAAKLVVEAFAAAGIAKNELGRRIGKDCRQQLRRCARCVSASSSAGGGG
jgi:hypothetical protein